MPCFQSTLRGITGHSLQAEPLGFHGLPDVDVRVSDHQRVRRRRRAPDGIGDAGLLRARDEMVDEHAEPAPRLGAEVGDDGGRVVDAAEVLDDDALDAQVVAPDLLDEFGVVAALDVDAAGERRTGPRPCTATEPEAVRVDVAREGCSGGGIRITGLPSIR